MMPVSWDSIPSGMTVYRVRATNTARDSENKIHDNQVALQYGFRAGLTPGVDVFGFMTRTLGPEWRARGAMDVHFLAPFYEDDEIVVEVAESSVIARREGGPACAEGKWWIHEETMPMEPFPARPLPSERPAPSRESIQPGMTLGSFAKTIANGNPETLLGLANEALIRNFLLGPWIHAASEVRNFAPASPGDTVDIRARISERFDRKGHEFVVYNVQVWAGDILIQTVRHTAIYRLREPKSMGAAQEIR